MSSSKPSYSTCTVLLITKFSLIPRLFFLFFRDGSFEFSIIIITIQRIEASGFFLFACTPLTRKLQSSIREALARTAIDSERWRYQKQINAVLETRRLQIRKEATIMENSSGINAALHLQVQTCASFFQNSYAYFVQCS